MTRGFLLFYRIRCFNFRELSQQLEAVNCPGLAQEQFSEVSNQVWLGMCDDKIACVWGLIPSSMISNRAYFWLLTTDIVEQHKFLFARHSQIVMEDALKDYEIILGHVNINNERSKRWLKWLGAKFGEPIEGFLPFYIRRK